MTWYFHLTLAWACKTWSYMKVTLCYHLMLVSACMIWNCETWYSHPMQLEIRLRSLVCMIWSCTKVTWNFHRIQETVCRISSCTKVI